MKIFNNIVLKNKDTCLIIINKFLDNLYKKDEDDDKIPLYEDLKRVVTNDIELDPSQKNLLYILITYYLNKYIVLESKYTDIVHILAPIKLDMQNILELNI